MTSLNLTPSQRKEFRALAHHLDPVVYIGQDGLTAAVIQEVQAALCAHELIKIRVFCDDRTTREQWWHLLAEQLSAAPIQHIGKLLILWRAKPPKKNTESKGKRPQSIKLIKNSSRGGQRPEVKRLTLLGNQRLTSGGLIKKAKVRQKSAKKTASHSGE